MQVRGRLPGSYRTLHFYSPHASEGLSSSSLDSTQGHTRLSLEWPELAPTPTNHLPTHFRTAAHSRAIEAIVTETHFLLPKKILAVKLC